MLTLGLSITPNNVLGLNTTLRQCLGVRLVLVKLKGCSSIGKTITCDPCYRPTSEKENDAKHRPLTPTSLTSQV